MMLLRPLLGCSCQIPRTFLIGMLRCEEQNKFHPLTLTFKGLCWHATYSFCGLWWAVCKFSVCIEKIPRWPDICRRAQYTEFAVHTLTFQVHRCIMLCFQLPVSVPVRAGLGQKIGPGIFWSRQPTTTTSLSLSLSLSIYIYTVGTESIQTPLNFSLCYIAAIC